MNRLYRALLIALLPCAASAPAATGADLRRAIAYLEIEVPKWKRANQCYSCHNDGDGLRALLAAHRSGIRLAAGVLDASLPALADASQWEQKPLARLQFAAAVREAEAAKLAGRPALEEAAAAVAANQSADGHWKVDEELAAGSPVNYGPVLATVLARGVLKSADARRFAGSIQRATRWLEARRSEHVLDLAAIVLALSRPADRARLERAQLANGSWNNEPFDTALAMLALAAAGHDASGARVGRAVEWLGLSQLPGGGWPGTTRPAGGESYAQHLSTTAWVVIALLQTGR